MRRGIPERGTFVFYDCICQGPDGPVNWGHCGISLGDGRIIHAWDTVRIDDYRDINAMTALSWGSSEVHRLGAGGAGVETKGEWLR